MMMPRLTFLRTGRVLAGLCLVCGSLALHQAQAESPRPVPKNARGGDEERTSATPRARADDKGSIEDVNALIFQVEALKGLYRLNARPGQLKALAKLAQGAAASSGARTDAKAGAKLTKAMNDLRDALLKEYDSDIIDSLSEKMDEARDAEDADLEEEAEVTDVARERAPQAARLFNIRQVIRYASLADNEVSDPLDRILGALKEEKDHNSEEASALHALVAEEVGWLVGGLDVHKAKKVEDQVAALLKKARQLKGSELRAREAELSKEARQIIGGIPYTDVLRNYTEHSMAVMLSNPQFEAAINARLAHMRKSSP